VLIKPYFCRELWITDLCTGRAGSLFVVTREGDAFELSHKSVQKSEKSDKKNDNFSDILKVKSRLPYIYRATSISCDPKGNNFGVLQVCPNAELSELPEIESSNMKNDFRTLLEETDEFDPLHDLKIIVGDRTFYAHKLIVAASCEKMAKLVRPGVDVTKHFSLSQSVGQDNSSLASLCNASRRSIPEFST
jgi:hypothetical protein